MNLIVKYAICAVLLAFAVINTGAQSVFHPPITNYSPKDYGKLRTPENWDICQDSRGVIYSAGGNGILEFDGSNWSFIEVKFGTYTVSLDVDKNGTMYAGAIGELGYLESTANGELQYVSLVDKIPEDKRNFSIVWNTICTDAGVVFRSEEYIFVYSQGNFKVYEPQTAFHTLFSVNGALYAREKHIGLTKLKGDSFVHLPNTDTLAETGVFGMVSVDNELLIITRENGIWMYNENASRIRKIESPDEAELNQSSIQGFLELSNGDIAVNTIESGVYILSKEGRIRHRINKRTGIRVNDVKSVFEDRENNLWLALNNGISKVNYNSPLSYYSEETNLEGSVLDVIKYNHVLLVGTSSGLYVQNRVTSDNKEFIKHPDVSAQVWDFCIVDDVLLVATSDGIFEVRVDDQNVDLRQVTTIYTNAIERSSITGDLIVAGANGIYALGDNYEPFQLVDEAITGVTAMVKNPSPRYADEVFWIGTIQQGIVRLSVVDGQYELEAYGADDGLEGGQWVRPFIVGDSVLFGTTVGVSKFYHRYDLIDPLLQEGEQRSDYDAVRGMFAVIPVHDTLLMDPVSHLIDGKERTWICANEQIMYFDKRQGHKLVNRPFWGINFGRVNRFYIDKNNVLWIGTADGLIRYKENNSKDYAIPFFSILRSIILNQDSVIYHGGWAENRYDDLQTTVDFSYNNIEFHFAAPYFEDDHTVDFSYILEGQDADWSRWSASTKAAYTTLREGDYVFKVKARNVYGQESMIASYTFTIRPPWYRTTLAYAIYVLVGIIVILIAIRISLIRLKRKNERLESIVAERTAEIAAKNEELEFQQEEITDSINYALRIQEAILPIRDELKKTFPDSFILFMPKDIVSGDFYWHARIDNKQIVVCADCTGHGVPGAFMSMIGTDKLNQFVKERKNSDPAKILSAINQGIKKSLKQSGEEGSTKDGMDAAICMFDLDTNKMQYAGANRSLWLVRNGDLIETKATKAAVAGHTSDDQQYELHEIALEKGDRLYMSTDGYADQFGGTRGKKLKVKAMKQIVLDHPELSMPEQGEMMQTRIVEWMNDFEQVDDICVIGIQYNG